MVFAIDFLWTVHLYLFFFFLLFFLFFCFRSRDTWSLTNGVISYGTIKVSWNIWPIFIANLRRSLGKFKVYPSRYSPLSIRGYKMSKQNSVAQVVLSINIFILAEVCSNKWLYPLFYSGEVGETIWSDPCKAVSCHNRFTRTDPCKWAWFTGS